MKVNIVQSLSYFRQRYKSIDEADQVEIPSTDETVYSRDMIVYNNANKAKEMWI